MIRFFLDPFNIFWLLLLISLVAFLGKKERLLKWLIGITIGWFLISSTPLVPNLLLNSLEDRYVPLNIEQLTDREAEYHIVILGGGHGFDDRLPPNSLLSTQALMRLSEGIRLYNQLPNSKLVLSGFSSSGRTTQAEMLRNTALLLGVDEERTTMQTEPGNTYEEAKIYSEQFGNRFPVIVVTSAAHMPRAMLVFRNFGIEPVASPTHYRLKGSWKKIKFGLPSMGNLSNMRTGLSEYAAIFRERYVRQ